MDHTCFFISIFIVIEIPTLFKQALPGGWIEANGSKPGLLNPFSGLLLKPVRPS